MTKNNKCIKSQFLKYNIKENHKIYICKSVIYLGDLLVLQFQSTEI